MVIWAFDLHKLGIQDWNCYDDCPESIFLQVTSSIIFGHDGYVHCRLVTSFCFILIIL